MCMCTETVDLWMWHKQMPAKVNGSWENSMHVTKNSRVTDTGCVWNSTLATVSVQYYGFSAMYQVAFTNGWLHGQ